MDKEKVIKGLEHCIRESEHIDDNPCDGCPYFVSDQYGCERTQMEKDALALLKEDCHNCKLECLLQKYDELKEKYDKLLKEQETQKFFVDESGKITPLPVVVRCKECKHRGNSEKCVLSAISEEKNFPLFMLDNRGDWFCADGERKE